MKSKTRYSIISLIALSLAVAIIIPVAGISAQANNSNTGGQALEISPPVINLSANPGQTIETKITLRDVSKTSLIVTGQVNDFIAAGEDGIPKLLIEEGEKSPYSIKDWIRPLNQLILKSKELKNLPVVIKVPANAAPGGYYGVVRFTATPPELKDTGVSLSASLGALILLRVNGEAKEGLGIEEFSVNKNGKTGTLFESAPFNFMERLKNIGNVHEQPSGQVTIKDMFGNKVAIVNINLPPRNVLPQSIRKFEQPLNDEVIGNRILFGKYTADLKVSYGSNKQFVTKSITFWVIPYRLIAFILVVLIGGFIFLRITIKRYNSHIIKKSQRKHRR